MVDEQDLRLMCILAHPDDESMGAGGILAKYADEGVRTSVVTATGGERGWFGDPEEYPGADALAAIRSEELDAACRTLNVSRLIRLGHLDGELASVPHDELTGQLVESIRSERPQVVVTFDPFGNYGHPDHITICQATNAAVMAAAASSYDGRGDPHRVDKLYYITETAPIMKLYQSLLGELVIEIDGVERRPVTWADWAITTEIDTRDYASRVWEAVTCHQSQLPAYEGAFEVDREQGERMWQRASFFRAFSFVNGGTERETDLFEGLR